MEEKKYIFGLIFKQDYTFYLDIESIIDADIENAKFVVMYFSTCKLKFVGQIYISKNDILFYKLSQERVEQEIGLL